MAPKAILFTPGQYLLLFATLIIGITLSIFKLTSAIQVKWVGSRKGEIPSFPTMWLLALRPYKEIYPNFFVVEKFVIFLDNFQ